MTSVNSRAAAGALNCGHGLSFEPSGRERRLVGCALLELLSSMSWVVHPLSGLLLAFLASVIFTRHRRQWPPVLGSVLLLILLSLHGAEWVVHPAAGLTLALLASLGFHAWRREWPTLLAALAALLVFALLGASWAMFPLLALGFAWLTKVVFSGELVRLAAGHSAVTQVRTAQPSARPLGTQERGALPEQGQGQPLPMDRLTDLPGTKHELRLQKRLEKLERRAQRLGVSLTKEESRPAAPSPVPPAPMPAVSPSPTICSTRRYRWMCSNIFRSM